MKHKKKFKELSFEKRCSIVESMNDPHKDIEFRSMGNYLRSNRSKKDKVRKNALSAIMKMRNI
tara:strand:+ start:727 stop:915 length:189 start_codon:yes stop_codon:yes gene_type:complete